MAKPGRVDGPARRRNGWSGTLPNTETGAPDPTANAAAIRGPTPSPSSNGAGAPVRSSLVAIPQYSLHLTANTSAPPPEQAAKSPGPSGRTPPHHPLISSPRRRPTLPLPPRFVEAHAVNLSQLLRAGFRALASGARAEMKPPFLEPAAFATAAAIPRVGAFSRVRVAYGATRGPRGVVRARTGRSRPRALVAALPEPLDQLLPAQEGAAALPPEVSSSVASKSESESANVASFLCFIHCD